MTTGWPLLRPMWFEFPDDTRFYSTPTQFMFGSSILVAPKLTEPKGVYKKLNMQQVTYALPSAATWYNYYSKQSVASTADGEWQTATLSDLEQAVYIRGGTILPILQHDDCMALLPCMENSITLEIYPDNNGNATGKLYVDDYSSLDHQQDQDKYSLLATFTYKDNTLNSTITWGGDYSGFDPTVTVLKIYNQLTAPTYVKDWLWNDIPYVYEATTKTLFV